ncbi:MAG: hypothetical protein ABMA02_10630 [Saprospiraceae bacterium]
MKKGLFLLSFLFVLGITAANAQSCAGMSAASTGKSCCMTKAAAAKAAAADASIEKRTNDDGAVAYVRKESDAQGNVKFVNVDYDPATSTFVNVAPKGAAAEGQVSTGMVKKSCSAEEMKACAGKGEAKACAGKAEGKACCASKAKAVEQQ